MGEEEDDIVTIISCFEVQYLTTDGTADGIEAAAAALATSYNMLSSEDVFERQIDEVAVLFIVLRFTGRSNSREEAHFPFSLSSGGWHLQRLWE